MRSKGIALSSNRFARIAKVIGSSVVFRAISLTLFCQSVVQNDVDRCRQIHAVGSRNYNCVATPGRNRFPKSGVFCAKNVKCAFGMPIFRQRESAGQDVNGNRNAIVWERVKHIVNKLRRD
jgi:hypothetical protein